MRGLDCPRWHCRTDKEFDVQTKQYRDIIAGAAFLVVAAILYSSSFSIITSIPGRLGAEFMPQVVAWTMAVLSVILIASGVRPLLKKNVPSDGDAGEGKTDEQAVQNAERKQVFLMLAVVAFYIILLNKLGFVFSSMLFLFVMMSIMSTQKKKRYWLYGVIAVFASIVIYYLFRVVFHLYLPPGLYPF